MGNIKNFNFNKLDLKLSNSDYWDFFLATDEYNNCGAISNSGCTAVWYDFNDVNIYADRTINATSIYSLLTWDGAINTGYTLNTIGLTGIDNGLITFDKISGDTTNQVLLSGITNSTLIIPSGDTRLHMTRVTGTTGEYVYPFKINTDTSGSYTNLCGGFYQGYYKLDGYSYEVLPIRVNQSWSAEFWLNPQDTCSGSTGTILNDDYPNNKGFFFYMGTRAENKYWNIWNGADTGCTSGCVITSGCTDILSDWCTVPKETEISIIGDYGVAIPLSPPQVTIDLITNPFLIYGRARDNGYKLLTGATGSFIMEEDILVANSATTNCNVCSKCGGNHDGLGTKTVCTYDGKGIVVVKTAEHVTNETNPFLIYGRATDKRCNCYSCGGTGDGFGKDTVCTFSGFTSPTTELDYNLDIIDNALGFRIKDDGSIGYRLLTVTGQCVTATTGVVSYVSGVTIEEGYSLSGAVNSDEWSYIVIKYCTDYKSDCELKTTKQRKGRLSFYVNGKLKYFINEFDEFIARRLNEYKDKQLGVPFNFSLGGGSQGLLESQTFDGLDPNDRNLPIQENFAGTFIGGISQFKFDLCELTYADIQNNYKAELSRYRRTEYDLITSQTFISTWNTNLGDGDTTITLPLTSTGTYNFIVDWGDGNYDRITSYNQPEITHTYASGGTKTISINGTINGWSFNNTGDRLKITSIEQWGDLRLGNDGGYFHGCNNLILTGVTDTLNLSGTTDLSNMFFNCISLTTINNIENWNVSNVTDMSLMFTNTINFNQPLSGWNVSNVTDMTGMFSGSYNFNQPIGNWNVSGVTNMNSMFDSTPFNQPISGWNVSNVTDMGWMFNFSQFNQPIGNWNVSGVTDMTGMFNFSTFNQDISNWNVSNVMYMNNMFDNAFDFNQDLGNWNVSGVTNMINMFNGTSLSTANYDSILIGWTGWIGGTATKSLKSNVYFDAGTTKYTCYTLAEAARNYLVNTKNWTVTDAGCEISPATFISTWNTTLDTPNNTITLPLTSTGTYNFIVDWGDENYDRITSYNQPEITHTYSSGGIKTIGINGTINGWSFGGYGDRLKITSIEQWGDLTLGNDAGYFAACFNLKLSGVTDTLNLSGTTDLTNMFRFCSSLTTVNNMENWDVSNVTNMNHMFLNSSFNQPIGNWNVSGVTDMTDMFYNTQFNQPLSGWNVGNVLYMGSMFYGTPFNQPIGNWDVSKVISMSWMFRNTQFNQPLSGWNVSKVQDMSYMFDNATNFNQDLSNWNVSGVTNMAGMFRYTKFNNSGSTGINNWNVSGVTDMSYMFYITPFNQSLSGWNVSKVQNMAYMFDGASQFNQDLGNWNVSGVTNMTNMFRNTSLSRTNYDSILTGWTGWIGGVPTKSVKSNVPFSVGTTKYTVGIDAESARNYLTTTKSWTITDGGGYNPFISTWYLSSPDTISLPLVSNGTYNFTVNWGDGTSNTITSFFSGNKTHNYSSGGIKTITIDGVINGWSFGFGVDSNRLKLRSIEQWGVLKLGNNGANFFNCDNLNLSGVTDTLNLTGINNLSYMFRECNSLTSINNVNNWNVSGVTNMSYMFYGARNFNQPLSGWNVSNVTDMSLMFYNANQFNQPLNNWNVSKVNNMRSMFTSTLFNQPLNNWNVGNVTDMNYMFAYTPFNQDLGNWNVSGVTNMSGMFLDTSLSTSNYNSILTGWTGWIGGIPTKSVKSNVPFSVGTTKYSLGTDAQNARSYLTTTKTWTITDGGGI